HVGYLSHCGAVREEQIVSIQKRSLLIADHKRSADSYRQDAGPLAAANRNAALVCVWYFKRGGRIDPEQRVANKPECQVTFVGVVGGNILNVTAGNGLPIRPGYSRNVPVFSETDIDGGVRSKSHAIRLVPKNPAVDCYRSDAKLVDGTLSVVACGQIV